jgi:hypothetical protein
MFGGSIDTLAEFGLQPRKTPAAVPPGDPKGAQHDGREAR